MIVITKSSRRSCVEEMQLARYQVIQRNKYIVRTRDNVPSKAWSMHEVNALSLDPDCFCWRRCTSRDSSIVEHPMLLKFIRGKSRAFRCSRNCHCNGEKNQMRHYNIRIYITIIPEELVFYLILCFKTNSLLETSTGAELFPNEHHRLGISLNFCGHGVWRHVPWRYREGEKRDVSRTDQPEDRHRDGQITWKHHRARWFARWCVIGRDRRHRHRFKWCWPGLVPLHPCDSLPIRGNVVAIPY